MAKYNQNHSKYKKALEQFNSVKSNLLPIIIPRNKIDAAEYKTSVARKQVKNLKILITIETIIMIIIIIVGVLK